MIEETRNTCNFTLKFLDFQRSTVPHRDFLHSDSTISVRDALLKSGGSFGRGPGRSGLPHLPRGQSVRLPAVYGWLRDVATSVLGVVVDVLHIVRDLHDRPDVQENEKRPFRVQRAEKGETDKDDNNNNNKH